MTKHSSVLHDMQIFLLSLDSIKGLCEVRRVCNVSNNSRLRQVNLPPYYIARYSSPHPSGLTISSIPRCPAQAIRPCTGPPALQPCTGHPALHGQSVAICFPWVTLWSLLMQRRKTQCTRKERVSGTSRRSHV